jgi:hypothetical protein
MSAAALDGPIVCQFDQTQHESREALHAYIRRFKLSRERYYKTYYPRYDLLTGEPIPFKDVEQYLTADFANKVNLKKWFKEQSPEKSLAWSKAWLTHRKEDKGLVYAPSQIELRTLCCPSMPYYEAAAKSEGGYYGVTEALGFKSRYTLAAPVFATLPSDAAIICDTREQLPLKFSVQTIRQTLNVGDYAISPPYDRGVRIERKSMSDFCSTLSDRKIILKGGRNSENTVEDSAYLRFDREIHRATDAGLYVVMIVEVKISEALHFDYLPQTKWVKATPSHIFKNLRDLLIKYPLSFQALFVDGRKEMADKTIKILQLREETKKIDLQFAYEGGYL